MGIASESTRDVGLSMNRSVGGTSPLVCLVLFSLAHKHKHQRKKNEHVCFSCAYANYAYACARVGAAWDG